MNQEFDNELPKRKPKTSNSFIYWLWGIIITFLIIFISPLFIGNNHRGHSKGQAISNAKQIGLCLFEFENDYGSYPDAETAKVISEDFPTHGYDLSGNSSNAAFRQLMAAGIAPSEEIFYARINEVKPPDGIITPGEAMKNGEVGFSYISGFSTNRDPATPLVLTPLIPGTIKFDPEPFDGQAIILQVNQSVRTYDIAKDGHVYDDKGLNILSAKHPFWKGKAPDIRYPE